jgi:hypothetical protein
MKTFAEFWPYYVGEHSKPGTRALHFVGSTLVLGVLAYVLWSGRAWFLLLAPVFGYGFAWVSHFAVEKNRPATFKYPLWSLMGDWKMWGLMLAGRMGAELRRLGLEASGGTPQQARG